MQTTLLTLLFAAILLFLGQRVYWLFVAAIGFVVGMDLATRWITGQPAWIILAVAILAGLVGALLAIFFQRLAVGLAGFFAGGQLALLALPNLGYPTSDQFAMVAYVVVGILAAILAIVLLDWALVILSALIGAAMIAQWAVEPPGLRALVFVVLFVIGAAVQASMLRRRRSVAS